MTKTVCQGLVIQFALALGSTHSAVEPDGRVVIRYAAEETIVMKFDVEMPRRGAGFPASSAELER